MSDGAAEHESASPSEQEPAGVLESFALEWDDMRCRAEAFDENVASCSAQCPVDERVRAVVVDWLVGVHRALCSQPETLFTAVRTFDAHTAVAPVLVDDLQLFAAAALLLSAKFHETDPPLPATLVHLCALDGESAVSLLLRAEAAAFRSASYKLCSPTAIHFLRLLCRVANHSDTLPDADTASLPGERDDLQ
eukprot:gene7756-11917_t